MKNLILSLTLIILLILMSGCSQPDDTISPGQKYSQKTIQLQKNITDYSVTMDEQLQNGGPTITRAILIKRPYMYRIQDSQNCYSLSNGSVLWSFCNESENLKSFTHPSVRNFIDDVDYQHIFTYMLSVNSGTMVGNDTINGTRMWIIETIPPRTIPYHLRYDYKSVRLWIDSDTGMILRAEMIPENRTNIGIIRFHNVTVNRGIPDDIFTIVPIMGGSAGNDRTGGLFKENLEGASGYRPEATPCKDCPLPSRTPPP